MNESSERIRHWDRAAARAWVEARQGQWDHVQWLMLLGELRRSGWGDLDPDAIGRVLERRKAEHWNLRRWRDSGEAYRWVEARGGRWQHHDWLILLAGLQCWLGPVDGEALGELLAECRRIYQLMQRWIASGEPARWVARREGFWDHASWLELLEALRQSDYADLPADLVGLTLEQHRRAYWRLREWESSGEPYRWVEAHRGRWTHQQWLRLLASLERSPFWPLDAAAVGEVLERARQRYESLTRWRQSGAALFWVAVRNGEWDHADFLDLLARLEGGESGGVEPMALSDLLESMKEQYVNLHGWLARRSALEERVLLVEQEQEMPAPRRLAA